MGLEVSLDRSQRSKATCKRPGMPLDLFLGGEQPTKIGTMHCWVVLTSLHIQIFAHLKICTSRYLLTTYIQIYNVHVYSIHLKT